MEPPIEPLLNLRRLLKVERDEDFAQYKQHFSRNNINYRREKGVTWYPVVITNTEIGHGEYLSIDMNALKLATKATLGNRPVSFLSGF